ncbi:helix-turn-helix domain-containing protein [Paenibacillus roseipurpureus]|uniref:AraC family transcriptional regulator n=1 Tax=Paenibacillus roseopurpureus TaxID=2918901 RepID=A0AA96RK56_9BACL|nr:AraC family transcriptional regulator [Paenibacillus sp. MBLB1832]WNR46083.1 AraC family transcriptional regulator [Paenibacillus sp. MBLB1832]
MSSYHLSHLFSEATSTSISLYVSARRVQQACFLFNKETILISGIAEDYFCKLFKELMGISGINTVSVFKNFK